MRPAPLLVAIALLAACAEPPVLHSPRPDLGAPPPPPRSDIARLDVARPPPPPPDDQQVAVGADEPPRRAQIATSGTPCASDPHILACARARVDSPPPIWLELGTSKAHLAIAWVTGPSGGRPSHAAYVARFTPSLGVTEQVEHRTSGEPTGVAIAALPQGGWMLVVTTNQGIEIHPLGADGRAQRAPLAIQDNTGGAHAPHLVARPDGGPLLVWSGSTPRGHITYGALLDEAGAERARIPLFMNVEEPHLTNAVFAGDAFLVAARVGSTGTIARIDLSGRVVSTTTPVGSSNEYHQLAWTGSSARVTFCDFGNDPVIRWASLDREGKLIAGPVRIGKTPDHYDPSPLVAIGEDSLVLLGGYTGTTGTASHLEFLRLDRSGQTIGKPWSLLAAQRTSITDYRMLPLGNKVALAWLEGARQPGSPATGVNVAVIAP